MNLFDTLFNRRLLVMGLGLLIVAGLSAIQTLPRQEDPRIVARAASVLTPYPGADPERVEALVTRPLEDSLRTIPEIAILDSTSRQGLSVIRIELEDTVTDTAQVWSRTRDKLSDVAPGLPRGVPAPDLVDDRGYAFTMVVALRWTLGTEPNALILGRYAELLEDRFRSLAGTDYVNIFGHAGEQVDVRVDPVELSALGLTVEQLAAAVQASDVRQSAGEVITSGTRLTVELTGAFDSLDRLRDVGVTTRDGRTVRLGEITSIRRGIAEPPAQLALADGQRAVFVGARMEGGQRVDLWVDRARELLEAVDTELPAGLRADIVFEQAGYTEDRLREVVGSLLLGLTLVVAILFMTMGWRSAVTVGLAIPATALLTLALFQPLGIEIHQMSITGIIVALGLMVDNAIVMTNAMRDRLRHGEAVRDAAAAVLRQLATPLLASTITTILAFMPIVLLPGPAGEFVGPLAIAVILALVSSYAVALILVPALSPFLLAQRSTPRPPRDNAFKRGFRSLVDVALRHPGVALVFTLCVPATGIALLPTLDVAFFPPADRDQFHLEVRLPAAGSIEETARMAALMDPVIRDSEGVRHLSWFIGNSAPMMYYNIIPSEDSNPAYAQAIVDTDSFQATNAVVPRLQQRLDEDFPQVQSIVRKYEQGPPFEAPLELRVYGDDLSVLADIGQRIAAIMHTLPDITHARAIVRQDTPKLVVEPDRETLKDAGLNPDGVAGQLEAALSGRGSGFILEGTQQLPVLIRYPDDWRTDPEHLASALLAGTTAGEGIPLGAVANLRVEPAWSSIPRRDGRRVQIVRGYLRADALPATSMALLENRLAAADLLPPGYHMETGGEAEERGDAVTKLLGSVALLVVLMVATVTIAFNSFRRMAIVFIAGAQALGLGMLALLVTGHAFGFVIIVGIMGLVGVAINATIIMLSALDEDPDARRGDRPAMRRVVTGTTSRHIWSTTITTFGGLIPLMLSPGDFWPPFAQTVGGGLLLATLVAFFFTPPAYRLLVARGNAPLT